MSRIKRFRLFFIFREVMMPLERLGIALVCLVIATAPCSSQILADPIVHWDFADGIPSDWLNTSASGIGIWEYRGPDTDPDNTVCSRGSCGLGSVPITSLTADNGFVIFDSNYWDDDDDVCGGLGTGQDPAPHTAWLTTAPINCSGYTTLVLTWQQQFKHYITTTKVQISNDGGNSFVDILTNSGVFSPASEWKSVNINTWAANQPDVRFRFQFSGTYYWWLLDDIAVYSPNPNDLLLSNPNYTSFDPLAVLPYHNMEYNMYPVSMIPQFNFSGKGTNIGGNSQTQVKLVTKVKQGGITQVFSGQSTTQTLTPGQVANFSVTSPFTTAAVVDEYEIQYDLDQMETDDNVSNNRDTVNYFITPYSYARDEDAMEDKFIPAAVYQDQLMEIGNLFEGRNNTSKCHSVAVALAEGTTVGTQIQAIVYKPDLDVVIATSSVYTVNIADLNSVGENFTVVLPLSAPITMQSDSLYAVMISKLIASDDLYIARSGAAYPEIGLVAYPQSNALFYLLKYPMVRMNIFNATAVPGCMDPLAMNYSALATADDGSCRYPGCTNELSPNYDPNANWNDGSCLIAGCTNPLADNYDPEAGIDDGSCIVGGCTDPGALNFDPQATYDNGTCIFGGCTDPSASNYDPIATVDDGSCLYPGCTNPLADNYDPDANVDDGSCIISGCTDPLADNFDPTANFNDGSCFYLGCTDPAADNYDPTATIDDGSCIYYGCTDENANNYDPGANTDDFSCLYNSAAIGVSISSGCAPLSVTVFNQTQLVGDDNCLFEISDGFLLNECVDSFIYTFEQPGDYFITYTYTQGTMESQAIAGPIAVWPNPEIPELQFSPTTLWMECLNCGDNMNEWNWNNSWVPGNSNDSLNVKPGEVVLNGNYFLQTTNEFGCSASSIPALVLIPLMEYDVDGVCVPVTVEGVNQSYMLEGQSCSVNFGDGTIESGCAPGWTHSYMQGGVYDITFTLAYDGEESTALVTQVTVEDNPPVPVLSFNDATDLIECGGCDGYITSWYINGAPVINSGNSIEYVGNGTYEVTISTESGCFSSSDPIDVIQDSIDEEQGMTMALSPNPVSEQLHITGTAMNFPSALRITDVTGKTVLHPVMHAGGGQHLLDVSRLAPGMYTLRVEGVEFQFAKRFFVVR